MVSFALRIGLLFLLVSVSVVAESADEVVSFNRDVRPILAKNCFACHGPDEETREANLRLDSAEGATAVLDGRRALVPGQPEKSELVARIESDDSDLKMPPPDSGHELSDVEKKLLRNWIAEGGEYDVHWSFVPPEKPAPPTVKMVDWPKHPVDYFVLARLEAEKLSPPAQADRRLRKRPMRLLQTPATTRSGKLLIDCWLQKRTASTGLGCGWIWLGMPTPKATKRTDIATSGSFVTG